MAETTTRPPRTTLPDLVDVPHAQVRTIRGSTAREKFDLWGSVAAATALTLLFFGRMAPFSGPVAFGVVWFLSFLGIYVLLVSLDNNRLVVSDKVATVLMSSAGVILFGALAFIVVYTLVRGSEALPHLNFFTETMEFTGPLDPLTQGGVLHAIVGTLIQISIALVITVPLGIGTAVFLNEVGGPFARFVRTISDAMTALPSVVAGLFVYAAVIQGITKERSGLAAAIAISVMMLPIMIRSADVVLRLVPGTLREASYALGASRWSTVWNVVLPTARSGLVTAIILGTARGIGETSPVLLTAGETKAMNTNPLEGPMISLPLQVLNFSRFPDPEMKARAFGTAAVLLALVLVLFIIARAIGGQGAGVQSKRQQRSAQAASARDEARFAARQVPAEAALNPVPTTALPPDATPEETR